MWLQLLAAIASFQAFYLLTAQYTLFYREITYPENDVRYVPPYSSYDEADEGPFDCGEIKNISSPFKLQESNSRGFELICQNNTTLLINLTLYYHGTYVSKSRFQHPQFLGTYQVKKINVDPDDPERSELEIADLNFASNDSTSNFCLRPRYSTDGILLTYLCRFLHAISWVRCRKVRGDEGQLNPATYLRLPCPDNSSLEWRLYLLLRSMDVREIDRSCQIVAHMPAAPYGIQEALNATNIWSHLQMGFPVNMPTLCYLCDKEIGGGCPEFCNGKQGSMSRTDLSGEILDQLKWIITYVITGSISLTYFLGVTLNQLKWIAIYVIAVFGIVPRMLAILFLAVFLTYKLRKKYSSPDKVEQLLQKCQNLMPRRYSYTEIKIITGHFREKLGQGGFGSLFKGSLFDHCPVAVKLLGKAKNEGQDFINEVATIGRVHHVNIVRLLGFCAEGRTRALVYEFMPNGSLDKYIFPRNGRRHLLTWEMLYKIALGTARGIEYLHGGCDMCITF